MITEHTKFRVMLVVDNAERLTILQQTLSAAGHTVVVHLDTASDLLFAAKQHKPDVICIDVEMVGHGLLASLGELNLKKPLPIALFAAKSDADITQQVLEAGVSVYVVAGLHLKRLGSLLQLAIARFELYQTLREELVQARTRLADTRDIEKAKGLIMKRRGLDEAAAYSVLRRMAMERKQRIGDLARVLLSASDVLEGVPNVPAAPEDRDTT